MALFMTCQGSIVFTNIGDFISLQKNIYHRRFRKGYLKDGFKTMGSQRNWAIVLFITLNNNVIHKLLVGNYIKSTKKVLRIPFIAQLCYKKKIYILCILYSTFRPKSDVYFTTFNEHQVKKYFTDSNGMGLMGQLCTIR